jgi:N utilization substance protein A
MVVSELRGEKIDIIPFNEEPARFVAKALSPARVREVLVDDENKQATVIVPDDQLSLAIGKEGQNARLAARLTGWRVDIRSETEFAAEESEGGYEEEDFSGRCAAILSNGKRCPNAALPQSRYCGLPAHQALADVEGDEVAPNEPVEPSEEPVVAVAHDTDAVGGARDDADDELPAAEIDETDPAQVTGHVPEEPDEVVASSDDNVGSSDDAAPSGVVPPEAAEFAEGTDLGPDREDPGTPSGAADSPNVPVGASATAEPEFAESDADGELEAADSDPLEQRLEER